jgi:hypothetical protein
LIANQSSKPSRVETWRLPKAFVDPATVSQTGDTALSIARQRGDAAVISSIEYSHNTP